MALTAPTVSGYSGFWNTQGDKVAYSMSQGQARAKDAWRISRVVRGYPMKDAAAALLTLIGAAPGGNTTATYTSVPLPPGPQQTVPTVTGITDLGGLRTAVTQTAINRNTTAADVTELKRWFSTALLEAGVTYPTTLGWSGGAGAKIKGGMSSFV